MMGVPMSHGNSRKVFFVVAGGNPSAERHFEDTIQRKRTLQEVRGFLPSQEIRRGSMGRIRDKITDDCVKGFKPPQSGQHIEWDNKIPGFGVRINAGGSKSFVLNYTLNGKRRRYKIGRFPAMSATAARITANQLVTGIKAGVGPPDLKIQRESAPTFADLVTKYLRRTGL
jgi:hypothetical protein